jgi:hypothetical protein
MRHGSVAHDARPSNGSIALPERLLLCPTLPTWAVQQIGSYRGYTGGDVDALGKAAFDPQRKVD